MNTALTLQKGGVSMALYAFDGTGNEDRDGDALDSNPLDFFNAFWPR